MNIEKKLRTKNDELEEQLQKYSESEHMWDDVPEEIYINEWSDLNSDMKQIISDEFEEAFKLEDPVGFKKREDSINSIIEEQKTDPDYFIKLIKAQFNNLIIEK